MIEGTEKMVKGNTASAFLEFISEGMQWINSTEIEFSKGDHHYTVLLLIRNIIQP